MRQFYEWLSMGGYAVYIWSSYAFVVFILTLNCLSLRRQRHQLRKKLKKYFESEQA